MAQISLTHGLLYGYLSLVILFALTLADSEPGVPFLGNRDPCAGYICLHGGMCVNATGTPSCACVEGFTGDRCEVIVSAPVKDGTCPPLPANIAGQCPGDVCSNDAVCRGTQKCCPTGCSTKVCANPNPSSGNNRQNNALAASSSAACMGFICLNGGTCQTTGGRPVCRCAAGFSGERCGTAISAVYKTGRCPSLSADARGQCPGTACSSDAVCPGDQKCCQTNCATSVCAAPAPVRATCDSLTCGSGSTCLVVRSSAGSQGEPRCVLDADRTCWASGYSRAHLVPSQTRPGSFRTTSCGFPMGFFINNLRCPHGTMCSLAEVSYPRICCSSRLVRRQQRNSYWGHPHGLFRRHAPNDVCDLQCAANERCVLSSPPCAVSVARGDTSSSSSSSSDSQGNLSNNDDNSTGSDGTVSGRTATTPQEPCDRTLQPVCVPIPTPDDRRRG